MGGLECRCRLLGSEDRSQIGGSGALDGKLGDADKGIERGTSPTDLDPLPGRRGRYLVSYLYPLWVDPGLYLIRRDRTDGHDSDGRLSRGRGLGFRRFREGSGDTGIDALSPVDLSQFRYSGIKVLFRPDCIPGLSHVFRLDFGLRQRLIDGGGTGCLGGRYRCLVRGRLRGLPCL